MNKNLNDEQWIIIRDSTVVVLKPFMCAQRVLEGETYLTISMIPYIIWKVRKGLEDVIESPESSPRNHDE